VFNTWWVAYVFRTSEVFFLIWSGLCFKIEFNWPNINNFILYNIMYSYINVFSCWEQERSDISDTSFCHSVPIRLDYANRHLKQTVVCIVNKPVEEGCVEEGCESTRYCHIASLYCIGWNIQWCYCLCDLPDCLFVIPWCQFCSQVKCPWTWSLVFGWKVFANNVMIKLAWESQLTETLFKHISGACQRQHIPIIKLTCESQLTKIVINLWLFFWPQISDS